MNNYTWSRVIAVYTYIIINITYKWQEARWSSGQCARRAIAKSKHRSQWPVLGWVTKNLLSGAPPCFGRHVKPLAAFAVISTHQSALSPRGGLWPVPLVGNP
jgi:hypothetical protein